MNMINYYELKTHVISPIIDDAVLNEIKEFMGEDGETTVNELISIYLNNTPRTINLIGEDLKGNDWESMKAHVHALKGSSAQVGVIGISAPCRAIEEALHNNSYDWIKPLFDQIVQAFSEAEKEFRNR
jgi:HPt (histidine-containing phosphotransfer) domain-containing protein